MEKTTVFALWDFYPNRACALCTWAHRKIPLWLKLYWINLLIFLPCCQFTLMEVRVDDCLHIFLYVQSLFIHTYTAVMFQACTLLIWLKGGQSWHQISKCTIKLWAWRNSDFIQGIKLYFTASRHTVNHIFIYPLLSRNVPTLEVISKLENLLAASKCGNIWSGRLWELSVSSCLDIFNLGPKPQWK